jgi:hypothetical protein
MAHLPARKAPSPENDPPLPQIGPDAAKIGSADGDDYFAVRGDFRARLNAKQRNCR